MRRVGLRILGLWGGLLFVVATSFGQPIGYRAGEVLVMLSPNTSPDAVMKRLPDALKRGTHFCFDYRLTRQLNIWLARTTTLTPNQYDGLFAQLRNNADVWEVQYNFDIAQRTNDPDFDEQWYLKNTGADGGVIGADVDAVNAWTHTTHSINPLLGDTAVICLIEAGYPDHKELGQAFWYNGDEVPDNGFDDDGNGFVDDHDGWNVVGQIDDCASTSHANAVCGVMGACTNNNEGIAGINWKPCIMRVAIPEPTEAQLIAAYEYPMLMRQLYNRTNGERGAFVVVTNSSFGIDLAQPADHPIWCSMYDYMGTEGILNVAATTNQNSNVDVVGDMPSGCSSSYLVVCTATTNKDIRNNTGYGANTVDIAAPGKDILSTDENNGYDEFTGTSMATPMVSAAISLLYGLPCALPATAIKMPQATALSIKNALFSSVDTLPQLANNIASKGRLNIARLVAKWKNENCPPIACAIPHHINTIQNTPNSVTISWNNYGQPPVNTKIILQPSGLTFNVPLAQNTFTVNNLQPCSYYTITLVNACTGGQNAAASYQFTTHGCCNPPAQIVTQNNADDQITLLWQPNPYIPSYVVQFRKENDSTWNELTTSNNYITLYQLSECSRYSIKITPSCSNILSNTFEIYTPDCDDCTDHSYCQPIGYTGFEWIDTLTIGNFTYQRSPDNIYNNGYLLHPFSVGTATPNAYLPFRIVPGYYSQVYEEMYSIYLDSNYDGDFDSSERIFQTYNPTTQPLVGMLHIPSNIEEDGYTRLRIIMRYYYSPENACTPVDFGEIHDFCILLDNQQSSYITPETPRIAPVPNPTTDLLQLHSVPPYCGTPVLRLFNIQGNQVLQTEQSILSTAHLPTGIYLLQVATHCGTHTFKINKL